MLNPLLMTLALVLAAVLVASAAWVVRWRATRRSALSGGADDIDTIAGWVPHAARMLTPAECQALETLRTALPEYMVLAQVQLARFIKVPTRNSYAQWLHRVGHLCVDLVVCDDNSRVVAVVEIQTTTQVAPRALRRQQRVLRVLKAAQIAVHVWPAAALPGTALARETILRFVPEAQSKPRSANTMAPSAQTPIYEDTVFENDAPPSTWFGDTDSTPAVLGEKTFALRAAM